MAAPVLRVSRRCLCSQATRTRVTRPRSHIDRIIRVDHAGELGADRIYAGQMAVLGKTSVGPTIQVDLRLLGLNFSDFLSMFSKAYGAGMIGNFYTFVYLFLIQKFWNRFFKISVISKPGKISAQPHTTLCIQFLDRENNDKNNTLPLGKQICFTIVWGCAEILP